MKRSFPLLLLAFISLLALHCQKEVSSANPIIVPGNPNSNPVTATLQGNILDESGRAAVGVSIKVGSKTATTNARGYFRIVNASLDKNASLITAEKAGYFKAYRTFNATTGVNQVVIKLMKKTVSGTVDAASGGAVTLSNGSKITLPANGVVRSSGGSYSGSVKIYATYIDPTASDIATIIPGSFKAIDKDKKSVLLTSYGMLAVELESANGERLQIATGSKATLTTPIPFSLQSTAPATISLWYVDEQTGIWKEEGVATKSGSNYIGDVQHFTYWNCDVAGPTVNVSVTFKTSSGAPLIYAEVRFKPASSYATAHGYTDSLGQINGPVPANTPLELQVLAACGDVIFSIPVGPFSSNTLLEAITVPDSSPTVVTVQGKLLNCSNAPVSNGYAIIYFDNYVRYVRTNASGDFATTFSRCTGAPPTCDILAIDESVQQQGGLITVNVISPVTNAGSISACGSSSVQYINYNLDGVNHAISNLTGSNEFNGNTQDSTTSFSTYVRASSASENIGFIFYSVAQVAGNYPAQYLFIQNNNTTIVPPFNVEVTHFASAANQFHEGNFSGQYTLPSSPATVHTISGSFRVRRQ